ncbi:alpha/beta fold hydrolase [Fodinicola feengrottensis]|uniref:alpha/beta fold hydrolase n=1 Tax=Fodinicola feengrottensis TaxID=435914 RepID=UPI0024432EFA|nr:alpha/beta hydrolase [Fodinicola feengrottensis]
MSGSRRGWIAQLLALDYPDKVATLTLISTRPTAPGPNDPDLPEHAPAIMAHFMSASEPDWSDRTSVIEGAVQVGKLLAGTRGFVPADVRENAARIFDRVSPDPAVQRSNHLATAFAALDCTPRWRERLSQVTAPTLVMHGAEDPFFPVGNAEALASEIPGARLRVLHGIGQAMVRPAWPDLLDGILTLSVTGAPRQEVTNDRTVVVACFPANAVPDSADVYGREWTAGRTFACGAELRADQAAAFGVPVQQQNRAAHRGEDLGQRRDRLGQAAEKIRVDLML